MGFCGNVRRNEPSILMFFALLLISSTSATTYAQLERRAKRHFEISWETLRKSDGEQANSLVRRRAMMAGLGSLPPLCISKCGRCSPCVAVAMPVRPGPSKPTEYYPEAWRCKCGNKLFMPREI